MRLNGTRGDTFIDINPGVTDPTAFVHVASHEVGHTFGLGECEGCSPGSSAMTVPTTPNLNEAGALMGQRPVTATRFRRTEDIRQQEEKLRQLGVKL